eukprot:JP437343.1.p2 GENE.JP437343.1~~JP437343.1.p2  ORF type:complete len:55 (-),score=1.26 JP437343.1:262-426(-)
MFDPQLLFWNRGEGSHLLWFCVGAVIGEKESEIVVFLFEEILVCGVVALRATSC